MSIYFFGTSNCIIGGTWVEVFRGLAEEDVVNASLGASPSKLALYQLANHEIGVSDVVILDYTVTEAIYQEPWWNVDEGTLTKDITSIVDYLERRGAYVIMMINPCYQGLRGTNVFEPVHVRIAEKLSLPVLNITELFRRAVALGARGEQLMRDNSHHAVPTSATIAKAIVHAVEQVRSNDIRPVLDGQEVWAPRVIPFAPLVAPEHRLKLGSSLRTTEMAALQLGEVLRLDVGPGEFALGMVVNMAGSGARVRIEGKEKFEIRDFIYNWQNDNRNAAMGLFAPMRTPIEGSSEGIALRVIPMEGEAPPPDIVRPTVLDLVYDEATIEGLLVGRSGVASKTGQRSYNGLVDLLETKYESYAEELLKTTLNAPACEFSD